MIRIINDFFLRDQVCENDEQLEIVTLRFKNNDVEESYQKKNMSKLFLQFRVYSLLQIIINFVYILSSGFVYKNWNNAYLRSGFIGWIICTLILQAKLKTKIVVITNIIIYINSVLHILLYSYFTDNITKQQGNTDVIVSLAMMSGLNQALFVMTFSFIQSSYLYQTLTLTTCFLTLMGIYNSFQNYKLWTQYLLIIFTCYLLRTNEKNNRLSFFLIRKNHQNLKACKKIYDETVPAQIIILEYSNNEILNSIDSQNIFTENRYADILYFNKSASFHFGSVEKDQILFRLNQIEIVSDQKVQERLMDKIVETHSIMDTEQRYSRSNQLDYQIANKSKEYQCKRQVKSQDIQYYDVKALGCIWEGKKSVMLIMNETTDRVKNIKQLQELDQYKDNLLASVSHDLKTPLNGLLMTINVMKSIIDHKYELGQIEIKEISRYIDDIISTQNILLSMINDLNDFSQLRKLGLRLNFTQFSLENCINQIKQIFGGLMDKKRLEFKIEGNYQNIEMFNDETRLKQILINLISNAIKFTYKGSITLIVQQIITEDRLRLIKFIVKDTGIGIPEHIQHKLFKAYSSFNIGNCNNYGVGLGLVISKQMVGLLGPKQFINLVSYESAGSTFSFEIYQNAHFKEETLIPNLDSSPIYRPPQFQPRTMNQMRTSSLLELQIATRESFRILIVDDDSFSSFALQKIIQNMFTVVDVDEALNGQLALEKIQKRKYDIIFMDLNMPIMDGKETIIEIRKYEKANQLPRSLIIVQSGFQDNDNSIDCDEYLEKPMRIEKFRKILNDRKLL